MLTPRKLDRVRASKKIKQILLSSDRVFLPPRDRNRNEVRGRRNKLDMRKSEYRNVQDDR